MGKISKNSKGTGSVEIEKEKENINRRTLLGKNRGDKIMGGLGWLSRRASCCV